MKRDNSIYSAVFYWILSLLVLFAIPSGAALRTVKLSGTLVVFVPNQEGLILAADSRTTINGLYCDQTFKIEELAHRKNVAIAVTGTSRFLPLHGALPLDVCRYERETAPLLDIKSLVEKELDTGTGDINHHEIGVLSEKCKNVISQYAEDYKRFNPLGNSFGKEIFRVAVGNYVASQKLSVIVSFAVSASTDGSTIQVGEIYWKELSMNDLDDAPYFGETAYVEQQVFTWGRTYLKSFADFVLKPKKVRDVTVSEAKDTAINLIDAASRTTRIVPPPSGIGGPIDVLLISKTGTTRLQWKSP